MSDRELMKKLENSSPEDAKKLVIESIHPECRDVAKSFFDCIEEKFNTLDNKTMSMSQMEKEFNTNISPSCMANFDLEKCLQRFEQKH